MHRRSPTSGPRVVSATWHAWDATWGDYHYGYGGPGGTVCGAGTFLCGGVTVRFDQPIRMRDFYRVSPISPPSGGALPSQTYGFQTGAPSGFELWQDGNETTSPLAWGQPAVLSGILDDGFTVQLNVTWISPEARPPTVLRYAWQEYPSAMPIENAFAMPAGPFNVSVVAA